MSSQWAHDDDDLVAALQEAFRAEQEVPREFIEMGQAAYTWRSIDAELAALTFDSATELAAAAAAPVRSAEASPRFLTFSSADLTIELEIGPDGIIGQIVPPHPGRAEARPASGPALGTEIDDIGCFVVRPLPGSPFRLHVATDTGQASSGMSALTTWITL
jgi:hypothetical protein